MSFLTAIGVGSSLLSGFLGSHANKDARRAQIQGLNTAAEQSLTGLKSYSKYSDAARSDISGNFGSAIGEYGRANQELEPFAQEGQDANRLLGDALGTNGQKAQAGYYRGFKDDPGFQSSLDAGLLGVQRQAAARGGLMSGGTSKELYDYGQQARLGAYQDRLSRLASMQGAGLQAAGQMSTNFGRRGSAFQDKGRALSAINLDRGTAYQGHYNRLGQLALGAGDAKAQSAVAQGNIWNSTLNNVSGALAGGYGQGFRY